jgi:hypothetical protein
MKYGLIILEVGTFIIKIQVAKKKSAGAKIGWIDWLTSSHYVATVHS